MKHLLEEIDFILVCNPWSKIYFLHFTRSILQIFLESLPQVIQQSSASEESIFWKPANSLLLCTFKSFIGLARCHYAYLVIIS